MSATDPIGVLSSPLNQQRELGPGGGREGGEGGEEEIS